MGIFIFGNIPNSYLPKIEKIVAKKQTNLKIELFPIFFRPK